MGHWQHKVSYVARQVGGEGQVVLRERVGRVGAKDLPTHVGQYDTRSTNARLREVVDDTATEAVFRIVCLGRQSHQDK